MISCVELVYSQHPACWVRDRYHATWDMVPTTYTRARCNSILAAYTHERGVVGLFELYVIVLPKAFTLSGLVRSLSALSHP